MNRRGFIQAIGASLLAGDSKIPAQQKNAPNRKIDPRKRARPNILLLMADQFRADCLGASGNKVIRTPHLDRLAQDGVRFSSAYSSTPTCIPARTALLTGLGPWHHGLLGFSPMATNPYPVEKPRAMAEAGYYAVSIGKNHYSPIRDPHGYHQLVSDEHCSYWFHKQSQSTAASWEERCDYESWFWSQMPDKDPHATGLSWNDYRGKPFVYREELHATHWTGQTAVNFLEGYERQEPFFLKVSFIRPHSPYDPPERCFRMYESAALPEAHVGDWADRYAPRSGSDNDIWHGKLPAEVIRNSRQCYYGNVTFVDEQIGRILQTLESRGLFDDTLILFLSDHGDMLGDHNLWRKSYGYEQSSHIPLLMRLPASLGIDGRGRVIENPVELRDILPTLLDVAGTPVPPSLDGKSLLELLRNNGHAWREFIDLEHNICYGPENHWNGLTDGKWKYLYHAFHGKEQLFHLESDPNELKDLSAVPQYDAQLRLWRGRLVTHLTERGPGWVSNGKLVPRPEGMAYSPNFPGQLSAETTLHRIDRSAH